MTKKFDIDKARDPRIISGDVQATLEKARQDPTIVERIDECYQTSINVGDLLKEALDKTSVARERIKSARASQSAAEYQDVPRLYKEAEMALAFALKVGQTAGQFKEGSPEYFLFALDEIVEFCLLEREIVEVGIELATQIQSERTKQDTAEGLSQLFGSPVDPEKLN